VIVVTSVEQTCGACPSQWEGVADDGRVVYARYRGGRLRVSLGATLEAALDSQPIIDRMLGDSLDGWMDYATLRHETQERMQWPAHLANE
jgi:hypothetical protein